MKPNTRLLYFLFCGHLLLSNFIHFSHWFSQCKKIQCDILNFQLLYFHRKYCLLTGQYHINLFFSLALFLILNILSWMLDLPLMYLQFPKQISASTCKCFYDNSCQRSGPPTFQIKNKVEHALKHFFCIHLFRKT